MTALLGALFSLYLLYLLWEAHAVRIARKKLAHVVHVNGTRGKSTVSRLIEAGLRAGGEFSPNKSSETIRQSRMVKIHITPAQSHFLKIPC